MSDNPVVASYVATFLKPDQWHVYRQLQGLRWLIDAHVLTHRWENVERFPYMEKWVHVLRKSRLRWWRRFIHKQLRQEPWQLYRWEVRELVLLLSRIDAQALHIYFGHVAPQFIPLMKVWKHPIVVSFHGADAAVDMDKPRYRAAMQEVFRLATTVQSRSEALSLDLIALGCPAEKIVLHRTGIPVEHWTFVERTPPADGAWRLVQSCRFIEKKGLDLTLRTFAAVVARYPNAKLTLVGDGPLKPQLEAQARELGVLEKVEFPGFLQQADLRKIVKESHVYLQPSRTGKDGNREGVPNAMLEGMATGIAVVGTRHGGIPEAVTDGVNGLLVPEDDGPALTEATLRVLDDSELAKRLGVAARATVTERFSYDAQARALSDFYRSLIVGYNQGH